MKLILNELSVPENIDDLKALVKDVLNLIIQISENKFDKEQPKFHIHDSFLASEFGNQFYTHIYSDYDLDDFSLFNSFIDCPPVESIITDFESSKKPLYKVTISFNNQELEGIGLKASTYHLNTSALYSFNSNSYWRDSILKTKAYTSEERFDHNELTNFSLPRLFSIGHRRMINIFLNNQGWKPSITKFPFAKEASDCYKESCKTELDKCKGGQEKIEIYRQFGELFATMNGYTFEEELSKWNTDNEHIRDIYWAGNSNHKRFISIDVENGGFEFCDYDGTHLGAFGWLGNQISNPKIETHSIKLHK